MSTHNHVHVPSEDAQDSASLGTGKSIVQTSNLMPINDGSHLTFMRRAYTPMVGWVQLCKVIEDCVGSTHAWHRQVVLQEQGFSSLGGFYQRGRRRCCLWTWIPYVPMFFTPLCHTEDDHVQLVRERRFSREYKIELQVPLTTRVKRLLTHTFVPGVQL